ncbi:MAG: VWA domain-containing protein, partial [Pirellulaceae bacterium]
RKLDGLTEFLFPLSTAKYTSHPVENLRFAVNIQSQAAIKNVYSPTHAVDIKRPDDEHAVIRLHKKNLVPTSDLRIFFDVGKKAVGASVLSYRPDKNEQGYVMMLVSPEIKKKTDLSIKKNVLFVVDRSGSMSGKKIEQAKAALKFVLNNLNKGDLFNVIAYDSEVESFQPEMQKYSEDTRKKSLGFVEGIYAGGSTNIDGALSTALGMLQDDKRPSYVVFMTDGLPTAGETNATRIVTNAKQNNKVRARIFNFGVGYDVNSRLLDKLARVGFGQSQYVRPNEDIEDHVSKLFERIGAPAMTDITIKVDVEGQDQDGGSTINRLYPRNAYDLFAGDQLVLVGRYKKAGKAKVTVQGNVGGKIQSFSFPARLAKKSKDETNAFVEKVWASRRIGEIIDEIDLQGKNQELVDELIQLSTKHGILTPYTSFLADDNVSPRDLTNNRRLADRALSALKEESGRAGFSQRDAKAKFQQTARAPAGGFGSYRAADSDESIAVQTIQNVGNKTFFYRNQCWIDSAATEKLSKNTRKIKRYSDEYFQLITRYGRDVAKYLALEGHVIVILEGEAYEFQASTPGPGQ